MEESILVGSLWLNDRLNDDSVVPVDVRMPHFFNQAHIPGAVNLPSFFFHAQAGRPVDSGQFAARLGSLGLTRESHIIAYDEGDGPTAAALYWTLRYFRHPRVSVLDGGITRWRHQGLDWEYVATSRAPGEYRIDGADAVRLADREDVLAALGDDDTVILDVRSPAEYLGLERTAARSGHIPGAINMEWSNNLIRTPDAVVSMQSTDELRDMYRQAGIEPDKNIIVYCGSGVRSSETYFVLDMLGYERVRNYLGGWQEWGNHPEVPVEET